MQNDDFSFYGQISHFFKIHGFQIIVTIAALPIVLFVRKLGLSFINTIEAEIIRLVRKTWKSFTSISARSWKVGLALYAIWILALCMYSAMFENLFGSNNFSDWFPNDFILLASLPPIFLLISYSLLKWALKTK